MAVRELVAVAGIERLTGAERRALICAADRVPMDPSHLAAVESFETAGTFRTDIKNPRSGFVGLIQFGPDAASSLGTSLAALERMGFGEQQEYVVRYYQRVAGGARVATLEDAYLAVFAGRVGLAPGAALYRQPSKAYEQNRELDRDHDGIITAAEATSFVRAIYEAGKHRPPVLVEMSNAARYTVAALLAALAAAGAAWLMRG